MAEHISHHEQAIKSFKTGIGPEILRKETNEGMDKIKIDGCEVVEAVEFGAPCERIDRGKYAGEIQTPVELERVLYHSSEKVRKDMENTGQGEPVVDAGYDQQTWVAKLDRFKDIINKIDQATAKDLQTDSLVDEELLSDLEVLITEWRGSLPESHDLLTYIKTVCDILSAEYLYFIEDFKHQPASEDPNARGAEASLMIAHLAGKSEEVKFIQQHPTSGATLYKVYKYLETICLPKVERLINDIQSNAVDQDVLRDKILEISADSLIYEMPIGVGTRNRFNLSKKIIKDLLIQRLENQPVAGMAGESIVVVSYAAGSGLAVNEAVAEALEYAKSHHPELKTPAIELYFIDTDNESLALAWQVAENDLKMSDNNVSVHPIQAKRGDLRNTKFITSLLNGKQADICEAVGIFDYLSPDLCERLIQNLANGVRDGGSVLTANIDKTSTDEFVDPKKGKRPYPQREVLENCLDWQDMWGRTAAEVGAIHVDAMRKAGGESKITIIPADATVKYPTDSDLTYHIAIVEKGS